MPADRFNLIYHLLSLAIPRFKDFLGIIYLSYVFKSKWNFFTRNRLMLPDLVIK